MLVKQRKCPDRSRNLRTHWFSALALIVGLSLWLAVPAMAAMPPAGAIIGNQASVTYTDASSQTKTATSNLVETTVLQVGSLTLDADNTKTASIGNTVYMPHTLTNTGNGSDTFTLTTSDFGGGDTDFATNINIYLGVCRTYRPQCCQT